MVGIQLIAKVGEKGQVVIPKPIRESLRIQPHMEVVFDFEDGKVVLAKRKASLEVFEEFVNIIKDKKKAPEHIDWDKEYSSQFE